MKQLILLFAMLVPCSSFAESSDCTKLAAFKRNQDRKLNLSRYGLGLVDAKGYAALNAAVDGKYNLAVAACRKESK